MKKLIIIMLSFLLTLSAMGAAILIPLAEGNQGKITDEDTYAGTLTYTPSEDGSSVTISYLLNGETVSYTVPANDNYLFGGYAATDDLGRSLFDSSDVGSYGADKERYIGLFYFLCQGAHYRGDQVINLQQVLDQYGPEIAGQENPDIYPDGADIWWGEPLYGYYYSDDAWVMRKHAELLTMAGIDFLYFDVTNGPTYTQNALLLMSILHELNEQGYDAPQVVFYTNAHSKNVIQQLYNEIYAPGLYPDTWFCIDGKPVIVGPSRFDMDGFFTVKKTQWPTDLSVKDGWPWMDFNWPQRVMESKNGDGSAISVSVAQHSGSVVFSDSSLYGDYTNRGRSYNNPENIGHTYAVINQDYRDTLINSYETWNSNQSLTMQGINFQKQFDNAVASDATYVLVTGWNEWTVGNNAAAHNYAKPYYFTDCASMEFSRDCEIMRGGYFDNYYIQMTYNIQRLKGTAPVILQDARNPIDLSGSFEQWDHIVVEYADVQNDTGDRNAQGGGQTLYTNTTGRNDIVSAKVTADTKNLYFYVETAEAITARDTESSWMQLYVNVDRETTGWYGYDFIINHQAKNDNTTTVAKYNGADGGYGFETLGEVSYRVEGNQMMIAVPQEMLGVEGYKEINFEFKWADSDTVYDEMEDFYCDGDAAPLGRLNYIFQNYIPGVSQISYDSETTATEATETVTEPATEPDPDTTPATDAATEATTTEATAEEEKGCASIVALPVMLAIPAVAVVLIRKKKDD